MQQLDTQSLKYPVWLVHSDLQDAELVDNGKLLEELNSLTIKTQSLIGCFIVGNTTIYKIVKVVPLYKSRPFYRFEFFNPNYRVSIYCECIGDIDLIASVKETINAKKDV